MEASTTTEKGASHHDHISVSAPRSIGNELLDPLIYDDHGDPHRAALEDANDNSKVSMSTCLAVFFLGFTFHPSLSFTLLTFFAILVPVGLEIQGSTANIAWVASAWSLAGSVAFSIAGQLSDYLGRKNIILFGQALLIVGHIIGATAHTVSQLIAATTILGLGAGITWVIYPAISEILPNRYRSIGLASTDGQSLPFAVFGPLIARALLQHATWRWIFYLGIISGVITIVGTMIFYSAPSRPILDRSRLQISKELDYLGILLYTSGTVLFLLGLAWGGNAYPWKSAQVLVPLILGVVLFVCMFVWDSSKYPKRPLVPPRLFKKFREFTSVLIVIFVAGMVFISASSLMPAEIGYVYTSDSTKAGYYNIAAGCGNIVGTILGGVAYKFKHIPLQLMIAAALQTIFIALMALITPDRLAMGLVFQFFTIVPFGWILTISYLTVGLHVGQRDIGLAYGLVGSARFLGGAVGTAIFSTILSNRVTVSVPARVATALLPSGFPAAKLPGLIVGILTGSAQDLEGFSPAVIQTAAAAAKWGYADAFKVTWLISIPFGVVAFVACIFVRDPSPYLTSHRAVTLKNDQAQQSRSHNNAPQEDMETETKSA